MYFFFIFLMYCDKILKCRSLAKNHAEYSVFSSYLCFCKLNSFSSANQLQLLLRQILFFVKQIVDFMNVFLLIELKI